VYYFQAFDWGYATNDPSLVASISRTTCSGCNTYLEGLRSVIRDHKTLTGGRVKIKSYSIARNTYKVGADYVADVAIDEQAVVLHASGAAQTVAPEARGLHSLVFLAWAVDRWQVVEVSKP
jgi:hypothetical protein